MCAFKVPGKKNYYTRPTISGERLKGKRSCGTQNIKVATAMEVMLDELPLFGYGDLVERFVEGGIQLPELYAAKMNGKLDELREQIENPPLRDVLGRARAYVSGRRVRDGVKHIERLSPKNATLSWLRERRNIQYMIDTMLAEGQRPNSVARSLYRAVAEILDREVGKKKRQEILFEVRRPYEDDSRDVNLTPAEIARLMEAASREHNFHLAFLVAILTGIDQSPLLRLRVKDFNPDRGLLRVRDKKTSTRPRTLVLSDEAYAVFLTATAGKQPDDPIWEMGVAKLFRLWQEARQKAGLKQVRWKDLRHVMGQYGVEAGLGLREIGGLLGHKVAATTLRYTSSQGVGHKDRLNRMAGLLLGEIKKEGG